MFNPKKNTTPGDEKRTLAMLSVRLGKFTAFRVVIWFNLSGPSNSRIDTTSIAHGKQKNICRKLIWLNLIDVSKRPSSPT